MKQVELTALFARVQAGELAPEEAARIAQGFEDLGFAKVDHDRRQRTGFPEVIYGAGKTPGQIVAIAKNLRDRGAVNILCTRVSPQAAARLSDELGAELHELARAAVVAPTPIEGKGRVLVLCAGTSDLPVADEAALTAALMGAAVERVSDAGVAGIHRLIAHENSLHEANVIVCVAGMEGALPSVVAGLTDRPIIAVPTSVGYGTSFGGVAALLAMLNSCGSGVSVVNIDNGFGAGYQAALINRLAL